MTMKQISQVILLFFISCACGYAASHTIQKQDHAWFIGFLAGGQSINPLNANTSVPNGSGLDAPYDEDLYSIQGTRFNSLYGAQAGYRWVYTHPVLHALSVGFLYQYFSSVTIDGEINQFSLPQFNNYYYTWRVASHLLLAQAKVNLGFYKHFSPYLNAGLGEVLYDTHYTETAFDPVTPRTSPAYGEPHGQFAAMLGAGLDYELGAFILSAGYQYSDLNALKTNHGLDSWDTEQVHFGAYHSHAFVFGLNYMFDKGI